jgi:CelD/BcsL family acetyltransferase involved in cellulose biosynthesis
MSLADISSPSRPNEIRLVNPLDVADWDSNLTDLPGAGFFHTAAWARVLNETYGYQPFYHAIFESGRLRALLPLMEINSWLTGRRGVGLPFTDMAEPLCPDEESFQQLFQAARHLAGERRWKYLECRGGKKWLPDVPASTSFLNHILDLASGEAALFAVFDDSVRRAVRKAERNNINLEFSQSLESMQAFYQLLCQTRRRHGVPPQPFTFFASIQRHVLANNHGWVVLARHGDRPVAGAVFFHFGRHSIYKFGASDETQQQLRANNLVMWRAIQHYAREGGTDLDFGRTSLSNTGLRKFKLGWGTKEQQIRYVRYDPRITAFVTAKDEAQGWHNRIFQTLPLPLSRLAGALLYRHIA